MRFPEVMTITEVAEYLRLPQSTLVQLAGEGAIPGMKVGGHWRFHRDAVDQWLGVSTGELCIPHSYPPYPPLFGGGAFILHTQ